MSRSWTVFTAIWCRISQFLKGPSPAASLHSPPFHKPSRFPCPSNSEIFLDRNPDTFEHILDALRSGAVPAVSGASESSKGSGESRGEPPQQAARGAEGQFDENAAESSGGEKIYDLGWMDERLLR
jgi:hypothetical protein